MSVGSQQTANFRQRIRYSKEALLQTHSWQGFVAEVTLFCGKVGSDLCTHPRTRLCTV